MNFKKSAEKPSLLSADASWRSTSLSAGSCTLQASGPVFAPRFGVPDGLSSAAFCRGVSSSEVAGGTIGKASSREIGQRIVKTILEQARGCWGEWKSWSKCSRSCGGSNHRHHHSNCDHQNHDNHPYDHQNHDNHHNHQQIIIRRNETVSKRM